jgi:hypothetical protein
LLEAAVHGMAVLDELVDGPTADLSDAAAPGSPAVRARDRQREPEPDPLVFFALEVLEQDRGGPASEPAPDQDGARGRPLVRVVRVQAAPVRA